MEKMTRRKSFVVASLWILVIASPVIMLFTPVLLSGKLGGHSPTSNPVVEFKPVSCIDAGGLYRCHDAELHVTCYKRGSAGLSCVPDQWTYRDEADDQTKIQK